MNGALKGCWAGGLAVNCLEKAVSNQLNSLLQTQDQLEGATQFCLHTCRHTPVLPCVFVARIAADDFDRVDRVLLLQAVH